MRPLRHLHGVTVFAGVLFAAGTAIAQPVRYQSVVFGKVEVKHDVEFRLATNAKGVVEKLKLDVYQPAGDSERVRPAVLWLHGGGFRPGSDKTQSYIVRMSTEFAKRGYVSVAPDYRVSAEPGDPMQKLKDAVEDCRAGLAWMKTHAAELGVDPQRIAVGGGSAGGFIAVSLVAVENAEAAKTKAAGLFALVDLWGSPGTGRMMGSMDEHFPPTVIVHGTADQSVPFSQSEALAARLKTLGIMCTLLPLPGAPHTPTSHMDTIIETTTAFVFEALKK